MITFTETRHAAEFVLNEDEGKMSRDNITIAASQAILPGQVLGKLLAGRGAVTVGNPSALGGTKGALTKANPAFGAGVQAGTYRFVCVDPATDGGLFEVLRPDGTVDGIAKVGTAYDGQVKGTIADSTTDFAAGDAITLAVTIADPAGEGEYVTLDPAGTDGSEVAACLPLYGATTGAGETVKISAITRLAEVNSRLLVWPAGITDVQKATALAQLATHYIIAR